MKDRPRAARDRRLLGIADGVKPYHKTFEILLGLNRQAMSPAEVADYVQRGVIVESDRGSTG